MQTAFEATAPTKPANRNTQFSIKSLLIATTAISIAIGMVAFPPVAAIAMVVTYLATITACLVTAISGRGWIRPFAILNGLYLSAALFILLNTVHGGPIQIFVLLLINFTIGSVIGLSGAVVQSFLSRRGGMIPVPNIPFLKHWLHNESVEIS